MNGYTKDFIRSHFLELVLSIPKTVIWNFKLLKPSDAIRMPIVVSYHVKFKGVNRTNFIIKDLESKTASTRIGFGDSLNGRRESKKGLIHISGRGKILISKSGSFNQGCIIIARDASVSFGEHFKCNYSSTIDCVDEDITFGRDVVLGWNTTIKNNDGHYVIVNDEVRPNAGKIVVGDHVWICSNATLLKGVTIGSNSVVAYGSLVTKGDKRDNVLIGGYPAKVIRDNINWKV